MILLRTIQNVFRHKRVCLKQLYHIKASKEQILAQTSLFTVDQAYISMLSILSSMNKSV